MANPLNPEQIVLQIIDTVQRQAEAIVREDFASVETLATETANLCRKLDQASGDLPETDRARLAKKLQAAVDQTAAMVAESGDRLGETRQEIQEVRQGKSATSAYRQAVPRVAAMSYSRQG